MANFDDIRGVPQGIGSLTRIPQNVRPILSQQPTTAPVQIAGMAGAGLNLPTSLPNNQFSYMDPRSIDPFAVQPLGSIDYASAFSRQPVAGMQTVDIAPTIKMPVPTTEEELTTEQKIQKAFEEGDITETELEARIRALAEIRKKPTQEKGEEENKSNLELDLLKNKVDINRLNAPSFLDFYLKSEDPLSADEIKQKVAERTAMFKGALGMDQESTKYLTFLEIAKSGLKLAGGKTGRFLQDFADAFVDLPTFLQKIKLTEDQENKSIKIQALQSVLDEEKNKTKSLYERYKGLTNEAKNLIAAGVSFDSPEGRAALLGIKDPEKIELLNYALDSGIVKPEDKDTQLSILLGGKSATKAAKLQYLEEAGIDPKSERGRRYLLEEEAIDVEIKTGGTTQKNYEVFDAYAPMYKQGAVPSKINNAFVGAIINETEAKIDPVTQSVTRATLPQYTLDAITSQPIDKVRSDFGNVINKYQPAQYRPQIANAIRESKNYTEDEKNALLGKPIGQMSNQEKIENLVTLFKSNISEERNRQLQEYDLNGAFGARGVFTNFLNTAFDAFGLDPSSREALAGVEFVEETRATTLQALLASGPKDRATDTFLQRYEAETADTNSFLTGKARAQEQTKETINNLESRLINIEKSLEEGRLSANDASRFLAAKPFLLQAIIRQRAILNALNPYRSTEEAVGSGKQLDLSSEVFLRK